MSIEERVLWLTFQIGFGGFAVLLIVLTFIGILRPASHPDPDPIRQNLLDASEEVGDDR